MGLFDHFPYTNVHELNLDWILSMMRALEAEWNAFTAGNSLTFADPLQHDISKTYAKNTIVLDDTGNAYVSLQAVPVGVALSNQDYWLMVFDYEAFIEKVNKNFTARYYRNQYRAASAIAIGDWLTVDDVLYKATAAIAIDDVLEDGVNITHFTLEDFIKAFMQSANQLIQQYKNDIDASELAFTNYLQAQFDQVLAGVTVDSEVINARVEYNGYQNTTLKNSITNQIKNVGSGVGVLNNKGGGFIYIDQINFSDGDYATDTNYSGTTGTEVLSTYTDLTGYIPIIFGDELGFYYRDTSNLDGTSGKHRLKIAFYDADKNWLRTVDLTNNPYADETILIEEDGFIRVSLPKNSNENLKDYHVYTTHASTSAYTVFTAPYRNMEKHRVIPCQWSYGYYNASAVLKNDLGRNRAHCLISLNLTGSFLFDPSKYKALYRVLSSDLSTVIYSSSFVTDGDLHITTRGLPKSDCLLDIQVVDINGGDVDLYDLSINSGAYERPTEVDLITFMGQSNIAGRGTGGPAPVGGTAYEFRAITDPTRLYPLEDPFGVNENVSGAIDDGAAKTGSCVPSFVRSYFANVGRTIIGVSASDGGTGIDDWTPNTARYNDAVSRINAAIAYLQGEGFTIAHNYVVWGQGEHDYAMSISDYATKLKAIRSALTTDCGIEFMDIARTGITPSDATNPITAQTEVTQEMNNAFLMGSTITAAFPDLGEMKPDNLHYNQAGLNRLGILLGINTAIYINTGKKPVMYDPFFNDLYYPHYN